MRFLLSRPGRIAVFLLALGLVGELAGWGWAIACAIVAYLAIGPAVNPLAGSTPVADEWLDAPPAHGELTGHASDAPRQVGHWGEIGMGGPMYGDVLMPDGAILRDISESGGVSPIRGGPLYLGVRMRRGGETALVYDSANRRVHDLDLPINTPVARLLAACAADPSPVQLRPVLGLLLDRDIAPPPRTLQRRLPSGRVLEAALLIPDDLRGAANPEPWAMLHPYRLGVDGRPTRIHVGNLDDCAESPSGDAFALRGMRLNRHGGSLWHVCWRDTFYTIEANIHADDGASIGLEAPCPTDGGTVAWRVAHTRWEPDGGEKVLPPPSSVEVKAHWTRFPLHLRVRDGMAAIRLPEELPPTALRYWD